MECFVRLDQVQSLLQAKRAPLSEDRLGNVVKSLIKAETALINEVKSHHLLPQRKKCLSVRIIGFLLCGDELQVMQFFSNGERFQ